MANLSNRPVLVDLAPHRLADVSACFAQVGEAIGRSDEAARLIAQWDTILAQYRDRHGGAGLKVVFLDWLDPPFIAGRWVPEMLTHLGVAALLGRAGEPSFRSNWDVIAAARPACVIIACCGFDEARARADAVPLDCPVILLDGHLHFSRPSPALLPSMALLSRAISDYLQTQSA